MTINPTGASQMDNVIILSDWREVMIAHKATKLLHDMWSLAAAECAAGELSNEDRSELILGMMRTFGFGDGVGWEMSMSSQRAGGARVGHVLHEVLTLAAEAAAERVLCTEGRATLINAVFLALGGAWRVDRAAAA